MKWFKHYTTASEDEKIIELMDQFGVAGHAFYFLLLEMCAAKYDGKSEPKIVLHKRQIRVKWRVSGAKVERILHQCAALKLFAFQDTKYGIEIHWPKLLEIKDNYSKDLQGSGKKLAPRTDKKREDYIFKGKKDSKNVDKSVDNFKSKSMIVASEIVQALTKFKSWQEKEVKDFSSDNAWRVIMCQGGWQNLSKNYDPKKMSYFQFQWSAIAEGILKEKSNKGGYEKKL